MSPQNTTLGTIGSDDYRSVRFRMKQSGVYRPEDNAKMQNYRYEIDSYEAFYHNNYESVIGKLSTGNRISSSVFTFTNPTYFGTLNTYPVYVNPVHFSSDGLFCHYAATYISDRLSGYGQYVYTQALFQINLSQPWSFENITTYSTARVTRTFRQTIANPITDWSDLNFIGGISFSKFGDYMFVMDNFNLRNENYEINTSRPIINERQIHLRRYILNPGGTRWNIGSYTENSTPFNLVDFTNVGCGIKISTDGARMFVIKGDSNFINASGSTVTSTPRLYQFNLSNSYEISSISLANSAFLDLSPYDTKPRGLDFSSDGSKVFITGLQKGRIQQLKLAQPWDITSGVVESKFIYRGNDTGQDYEPKGIHFAPDGLSFYVSGSSYLKDPFFSQPPTPLSRTRSSIIRYGLIVT